MKKYFCIALAAMALGACNSGPQFEITGSVSGADGKMLYLEASALEGIVPLDSVKLKGDGTFTFRQARPASPEFYRLRLDDKVINLSIDSTETVKVTAPAGQFDTGYQVEGSANCEKIKELTLKQAGLQDDANQLASEAQAGSLPMGIYQERLAQMLKKYKDDVKINYIFAAPNTASAYFALFQKLNNYLIFDPLNSKDDVKCFAAVATSLNNRYPEADRTKNLYNIVIKGMKNTRAPRQEVVEIPEERVQETGVIDIDLRDLRGASHKLTDLKGKVVLLDFTVYQSAVSASHNYMLRDLYDKYASRGLEIYQVSLDADEHYWKTIASNLPWTCVRDAAGVYSTTVSLYGIQSLPSVFLINRANELKARGETIKDLEAAVRELL